MLISQESGFLCHKGWCKESLPTPSKTLVSSPAPGHYSAVVLKVQLLHILLTSQKVHLYILRSRWHNSTDSYNIELLIYSLLIKMLKIKFGAHRLKLAIFLSFLRILKSKWLSHKALWLCKCPTVHTHVDCKMSNLGKIFYFVISLSVLLFWVSCNF